MGDEEYGKMKEKSGSNCEGGGYSIFLDEMEMFSFMEEGDFSSARNLDHFRSVEEEIEKKLREDRGYAILAMSVQEKRISRDFTVLQLAHLLSKKGKKVIIADCDFLYPGLSGLVQNVEDHGFLDLLLYGSSLKSVMKPTGIDGVRVTGTGSFPVSRTIPFALKEFSKVNDFLSSNSDVVIYCSTLYTDDGGINPIPHLVDGLLLCCRIEEMEEGELQKILDDLGPDLPSSNLVCFCEGKGSQGIPGAEDERAGEEILDLEPESALTGPAANAEDQEPEVIEKSEEIDSMKGPDAGRFSIPRLVAVIVSTLIVVFIIWWFVIEKSVQEKEDADRISELVVKQQDVRDKTRRDNEVGPEEDGKTVIDEEITVSVDERKGIDPGDDKPVAETEEVLARTASGEKEHSISATYAAEGMYYSIHIASFLDIQRARAESDYFEKKEYETRITEVEIKGRRWYRVFIGELETKEAAEVMRQELLSFRRIAEARVMSLKNN